MLEQPMVHAYVHTSQQLLGVLFHTWDSVLITLQTSQNIFLESTNIVFHFEVFFNESVYKLGSSEHKYCAATNRKSLLNLDTIDNGTGVHEQRGSKV